MNSSNQYQNS